MNEHWQHQAAATGGASRTVFAAAELEDISTDCARLVEAGECGRSRSQAYMLAHCAASCDDHERALTQAAATQAVAAPRASATASATATASGAAHEHGARHAHEHEHELHASDSDGFHTQARRGGGRGGGSRWCAPGLPHAGAAPGHTPTPTPTLTPTTTPTRTTARDRTPDPGPDH